MNAFEAAEKLSTEVLAGELKRRGVFVFVGTVEEISRAKLPNLTPRDLHVVIIAPL